MSHKRRGGARPKNSYAFIDRASIATLAHNESPIGQILRSLPDWMLPAADKWAQQEADYVKKHPGPWQKYLTLPDPWQYLLDAPGVSAQTKKVCRAAQSWLVGLRKLCHMATGYGTLNTDWYMETAKARAEGDKGRENYAIEKIANKIGLSNLIQQDLRTQKNPQLSEEAAMWRRKRREQLGHYCKWQRAEFEPMLRVLEIERSFPLEYFLVESWLCFPAGPCPGLMFWSNTAITKWWLAQRKQTSTGTRFANLERDRVQKTRQRLGLLPVNGKRPVIEDIKITASSIGGLKVTLRKRDGTVVFEGEKQRRH